MRPAGFVDIDCALIYQDLAVHLILPSVSGRKDNS